MLADAFEGWFPPESPGATIGCIFMGLLALAGLWALLWSLWDRHQDAEAQRAEVIDRYGGDVDIAAVPWVDREGKVHHP